MAENTKAQQISSDPALNLPGKGCCKISQIVKECALAHPERMDAPAMIDCSRTWTYAQIFDEWEKYARVFTALGITEAAGSRVAIVGSISAEPLHAYFGCNMVGACVSMFSYPDLLPGGRWKTMVEKEHITDMVISDIMVTPQMWEELKKAKKEFGLRHIILLHSLMGGPCTGYAEMLYNEFNCQALKRIPDVLYMDDLLVRYADHAIRYAENSDTEPAVICHTSGTANGTRKPLPFTDSMVIRISGGDDIKDIEELSLHSDSAPQLRLVPPFDYSTSMNINGFVCYHLSAGNTLVLTFFGFMHPKFVKAFSFYNIGFSFASGFMIDRWMQMPDLDNNAFSTLGCLGLGGSYVPSAKFEQYEKFLKEHGFKGVLAQGYGMSELAGCSLLRPKDCSDDILGYPDNVDNYRILDENDGKFYRTDEGVRTGILYGRSDSMCQNFLDGEKLFDFTEIDGRDFLCTNDCVRVGEDGSLSYAGRSNRFFANNEGVLFEAGIAETALSAHPDISVCAVVPVLDKRIHDTVPVLYIIPAEKDGDVPERICRAVADVFLSDERLRASVLPSQFILVDDIPLSSNGKVDVYHITRSRLEGTAYNLLPVKTGGTVTGLRYETAEQLSSNIGGTLPEGMSGSSAYDMSVIFNTPPELTVLRQLRRTASLFLKSYFQKGI